MTSSTRTTSAAHPAQLAPLLPGGEPVESLLRKAQFFTPGTPTPDHREVHRKGGRQAEQFYKDRWHHDKEVRSTHGVNCTGSCSWKVYVKDGIITWETQQTDYPSVGPDSPEYEPRGCPRGASFSWYTYSPARVRYPYIRGPLLKVWREAKARLGGHHRQTRTDRAIQAVPGHGRVRPLHLVRGVRTDRGRARADGQAVRPGSRGGLLPHSGDVPGLVRGRHSLPVADRRHHPVVLRLVRGYADRLPAGLRRSDGRAGIRRLVEFRVPHAVGLEPADHPHPRRAFHDGGTVQGAEGRGGKPGLRRPHEIRRRLAAVFPRKRRRARHGDGARDPHRVLSRPAGGLFHRLRQEIHRSAVPGHPAQERRRIRSGQVPDRCGSRPRSGSGRASNRAHGFGDRRTGIPERHPGVALLEIRRGQVEPRPRGRRPGADDARPRWRIGRRGPAAIRHRRDRGRNVDPARRPGGDGRWAPGHHRVRPAARAVCREARRPAGRVAGRI